MTPASADFILRLHKIIAHCSLLPTTTCPICIDNFNCQDELLQLPNCHHLFHWKCILPWFSRINTCPVCRHVFPVEQPQHFSVRLKTQRPLCLGPWHQSTATDAFHLHFHLRPLPPLNCDPPPLRGPLMKMLAAEGYPELATLACRPFWISIDRLQQPSASN